MVSSCGTVRRYNHPRTEGGLNCQSIERTNGRRLLLGGLVLDLKRPRFGRWFVDRSLWTVQIQRLEKDRFLRDRRLLTNYHQYLLRLRLQRA